MLTRYTYVYLSDILNQMYLKQTYLNLLNMYSWILKSPAASSRFSAKTIIHYILKMLIGYRYRYICIRFAWISSCPCCKLKLKLIFHVDQLCPTTAQIRNKKQISAQDRPDFGLKFSCLYRHTCTQTLKSGFEIYFCNNRCRTSSCFQVSSLLRKPSWTLFAK